MLQILIGAELSDAITVDLQTDLLHLHERRRIHIRVIVHGAAHGKQALRINRHAVSHHVANHLQRLCIGRESCSTDSFGRSRVKCCIGIKRIKIHAAVCLGAHLKSNRLPRLQGHASIYLGADIGLITDIHLCGCIPARIGRHGNNLSRNPISRI